MNVRLQNNISAGDNLFVSFDPFAPSRQVLLPSIAWKILDAKTRKIEGRERSFICVRSKALSSQTNTSVNIRLQDGIQGSDNLFASFDSFAPSRQVLLPPNGVRSQSSST
jgi:hypothetical protein